MEDDHLASRTGYIQVKGSRLVLLNECGHFSYLECPEQVGKEILDFFSQYEVE